MKTAILESYAILISGHDLFATKPEAKLSCGLLNTLNLTMFSADFCPGPPSLLFKTSLSVYVLWMHIDLKWECWIGVKERKA